MQKRSSASPSPSVNSLGKDHSVRNSMESGSTRLFDTGMQEITDIPDDYLSQSSVLKHLAKEVKAPSPESTAKKIDLEGLDDRLKENFDFTLDNVRPPPAYPSWLGKNRSKSNLEKIALSKSQPDLSTVGLNRLNDLNCSRRGTSVPRPKTKGREEYEYRNEETWPNAEIIEILVKENSALKMEVEQSYKKVAKAQQVCYCNFHLLFLILLLL